jgi:glycosyltransferase involved in cell wall biosynthesis
VEQRRLDRFRPVADRDVPDADVVVATWWLTAEWVASLSPRKGVKVQFVQGHDADVPGQPEARVAATWRLPFHRIVCSRWLLDLARNRYGDHSAVCVPNGVDLTQFSAPPRDRQAQPTLGLVYSDIWIKGCDVAVEALGMAARHLRDLRLVSFGLTPVSTIVPLPARTEFTLLPEQSQIARLYASCDAWLWPSRREGFGLPILEAMACRTPVIAAPAGAAPELLDEGGGILLPSADPAAMAGAIEQVLALPGPEWRRMSEEARAVAARHRWEDSALSFESALEAARQRGSP